MNIKRTNGIGSAYKIISITKYISQKPKREMPIGENMKIIISRYHKTIMHGELCIYVYDVRLASASGRRLYIIFWVYIAHSFVQLECRHKILPETKVKLSKTNIILAHIRRQLNTMQKAHTHTFTYANARSQYTALYKLKNIYIQMFLNLSYSINKQSYIQKLSTYNSGNISTYIFIFA